MNAQEIFDRSFVFEHNGVLYRYVEKIIKIGNGEPSMSIDLTGNTITPSQPSTVQRLSSAIRNDDILIDLTNEEQVDQDQSNASKASLRVWTPSPPPPSSPPEWFLSDLTSNTYTTLA